MIQIINTLASAKKYLKDAEQVEANLDFLWNHYMIEPYWEAISQYAPFDHSFMKPKPIQNLSALHRQIEILDSMDFDSLVRKFEDIVSILPKDDEDPIFVAVYPLDDENHLVKERQNGVIGACVFGNILLTINPLANNFEQWIEYVFSHEYYHSVWGNYWFVKLQGEGLKNNLLEAIINEGEADYFALKLHPGLQPQWLSMDEQVIKQSWDALKHALNEQDRNQFDKFMFGNEEEYIPWTAGYKVGYYLVSKYMAKLELTDFNDLLTAVPEVIFNTTSL